MSSEIHRHFVTLDNRQIHYRRAGHGPPVILLHQSPTSSRECEPLMRRMLHSHTVFAPDMPGYGSSDPLPERVLRMEMLADNLALFMDAVGVDIAGLYGFHTGASLATAFARRHARRVSVSIAVGLMCLAPPEQNEMLQHYFPPLAPQWDGSHLAWLWSRLKDQSIFFPWFKRDSSARLGMDGTTPLAVQANLVDWLRSGAGYRAAYEAAFLYRPESDLPYIGTPHFVVGIATDPLFAHLDRLPAAPCLQIIRCASATAAVDIACDLLAKFPSPTVPPRIMPARLAGLGSCQDYVTVDGIQLRILRSGDRGRPVLLQHGAQSSLDAWRDWVQNMGTSRCTWAVELPGHGASDSLPASQAWTVTALAALLRGALRELGLTHVELVGVEAGAAIQAACVDMGNAVVSGLTLISAIDVTQQPTLKGQMLESYQDASPPDFFGGHLLRAWHTARDHLLFFPWYERRRDYAVSGDPFLDLSFLQRAVTDSIVSASSGLAVRRAEVDHALLTQLSALRCPLRFAAPTWSPRSAHSRTIAQAAGHSQLALPRDPRDWTAFDQNAVTT